MHYSKIEYSEFDDPSTIWNSFSLRRDTFYILISIRNNTMWFKPIYIDKNGVYDDTIRYGNFYLEYGNNIEDLVEAKSKIASVFAEHIDGTDKQGNIVVIDNSFRYGRLDLEKRSILMLRPHSTLVGCRIGIVELILYFGSKGILDTRKVKLLNEEE